MTSSTETVLLTRRGGLYQAQCPACGLVNPRQYSPGEVLDAFADQDTHAEWACPDVQSSSAERQISEALGVQLSDPVERLVRDNSHAAHWLTGQLVRIRLARGMDPLRFLDELSDFESSFSTSPTLNELKLYAAYVGARLVLLAVEQDGWEPDPDVGSAGFGIADPLKPPRSSAADAARLTLEPSEWPYGSPGADTADQADETSKTEETGREQ